MIVAFFNWVASLPPQQAWGLFLILCIIMAFVPYAGVTFRYLSVLFQHEKPEILDFSWRLAEDQLLQKNQDKSIYLNASNQGFILEGSKILINWNVKGAYRIDVLPIGKKLKGNTAIIAAHLVSNGFTLVAHTWKGKITQKLVINPALYRQLNTLNLSNEDHFLQSNTQRNTTAFSSANVLRGKYSSNRLSKLPLIKTTQLKQKQKRLNYNRQIRFLHAWMDRGIWKKAQSRFFKEHILHASVFHPSRYSDALNLNENEKLIS